MEINFCYIRLIIHGLCRNMKSCNKFKQRRTVSIPPLFNLRLLIPCFNPTQPPFPSVSLHIILCLQRADPTFILWIADASVPYDITIFIRPTLLAFLRLHRVLTHHDAHTIRSIACTRTWTFHTSVCVLHMLTSCRRDFMTRSWM